jgi:hypothetical protein
MCIEINSVVEIRPTQRRTLLFITCPGMPLVSFTLSVTQISQAPSLIVMTIAGSRMHRHLVDFASASTDMYDILQLRYFTRSLWAMFQCTRWCPTNQPQPVEDRASPHPTGPTESEGRNDNPGLRAASDTAGGRW